MPRHPFTRNAQAARYLLEGASVLILAALLLLLGALHFTRPSVQYEVQEAALGNTVIARVLAVEEASSLEDDSGYAQVQQTLTLRILSRGEYQGREITVLYRGMGSAVRDAEFAPGERALVMVDVPPDDMPGGSSEPLFTVTDHVRLTPLAALTVVLAIAALVIGRWQGMRALIGLALTVLLLYGFIIPQILAGREPMAVTLVGIGAVLAMTTFLIQGWNPPAHAALLGIFASLLTTAALAVLWTRLAHLTGFGSEETLYLHAMGVRIDMRGLLLAGTIIGAGGVLDDVVLAQSVSAFELAAAAPDLGFGELYRRTMKVGNAHLLTMVNTLFLAYASSALPLLLMFVLYPEPGYVTLNRELIAQEVVHALVGSLGVMLAVPLTTWIAAWVAVRVANPAQAPAA